jgi:hypothetical protein
MYVLARRWPISASLVACGHCVFRKLLDGKSTCGVASRLQLYRAEI